MIGPAVDALATLGLVVKKTIDELPQTGKAPNTAAVAPIGLIHDALIAGWGKAPLHLSNASTCHAIRTSGRIPIPRF